MQGKGTECKPYGTRYHQDNFPISFRILQINVILSTFTWLVKVIVGGTGNATFGWGKGN